MVLSSNKYYIKTAMFDLLEIRTLGQLHIQWRSATTPLVLAPRETLLLVYLAYQQLPISRHALYDLLWPQEERPRAQGNLRKLLLDLRRSVGNLIQADREVVTVQDSPHSIWLDVHKFKWHMTPLLQPQNIQTPQAIDIPKLIEGVKLYRGDFLADLKAPRSYHLSAWVDQEQRGLRQQMSLALRALVTHFSVRAQYRDAIHYATQLLQLNVFDELMVGETMRLWSYVGERDQALTLFRTYRQTLRRELKSAPSPTLEQLYQEIRSGITPAAGPAPAPGVRNPPAAHLAPPPAQATGGERQAGPLHTMPKPLTPLVGREEVMTKLHHMVQDPTVRLITLAGPGGIGKTHLALTLGNQLADQELIKVAFVGLERFHDTLAPPTLTFHPLPPSNERRQQVMRAIADLFSPAVALDEFAIGQLLAQLHQHNLLLIMDYFDPFMAEAPLLTELLQNTTRLKLLVTARGALQIPGEAVIRLAGLTTPAPAAGLPRGQSPAPSLTAAVELFLRCVKRHDSTAKHDDQLPAIEQICQLLEGNPLALVLAAGLTPHYHYTELVELLAQGIDGLTQSGHGLPRRQQSLALLLAQTWGQLAGEAQQLLLALTVFEGSFSRKAAMTVAGATLEQLGMLVNHNWLLAQKAGRYRMPRLIYHYVKRHVSGAQPAAQQLQAHHAEYYLSHFLEQIATNRAAAQGRVRFVFMEDEGNIAAALRWTLAYGEPQHKAACQRLLPLLEPSPLLMKVK